ncbi:MAG: GNAT family N-acetyltransferase [Gemmatimonas sp.]
MADTFIAVPATAGAVGELSALDPTNCFATASYFDARKRTGDKTFLLSLRSSDNELRCGCGAFLRVGRFNRSLGIASLPKLDAANPFWNGLRGFCREHKVTLLELGTFGSPSGVEIPEIGERFTTRPRMEFVVDLRTDLPSILGSNHKRNVKRGAKSGLVVQRTRSAEGTAKHHELMNLSLNRRRERGEDVPDEVSPDIAAFLEAKAGELFQAVSENVVLSSVLVLRSRSGAYYQTAGTSAEGMAAGASHFLIHNIALALRAEGVEVFNLGGGDEASTLARFKEGFGATPVKLIAADCFVGSPLQRRVGRLIELATSDRASLKKLLLGR